VLSEAERTAALYSLLQESTQVQIRFFITVLQQMARSDPMSALLSPSHSSSECGPPVGGVPHCQLADAPRRAADPMADQMEAKLASLGLKSPSAMKSPASPGGRGARQSSDAAGFLSPNLASMYGAGAMSGDAASMLAAQRAKLKANRISAPGTLAGDSSARNFNGGSLDQVAEGGRSPGAQPHRSLGGMGADGSGNGAARPKSTDGLSQAAKSPRASGPLDDQLSPIQSGNWSSMVNTPLLPMFDEKAQGGHGAANADLDAASAQLAAVGNGAANSRILLEQDVAKYRRKSQQGMPGQGGQQQQTSGAPGVQGVLSGMYDGATSPGASPNMGGSSPGPWNATQQDFLRHAMANVSSPGGASNGGFNMAMSPNALAGLQSPSGGLGNPVNMQMMNAMAAMGGLGNMSAAQFLAMQQQILQSQQQIAAMAAAGNAGTYRSQHQLHQQQQQQMNQPMPMRQNSGGLGGFGGGLSPGVGLNSSGRRSPGLPARTPMASSRSGAPPSAGAPGGGKEEEEVPPLNVLEDTAAWLRYLRLHKYTPNFEGSKWRDMVLMDDAALEAKGVAALGARRKLLKTFELVRAKYGIKTPGDDKEAPEVPSKDAEE
jgi:hypothetical protein